MKNPNLTLGYMDLLEDSYSKEPVKETLFEIALDLHHNILSMLKEVDVLQGNTDTSQQKELVKLSDEIRYNMKDLIHLSDFLLENDTLQNAIFLGATILLVYSAAVELRDLIQKIQKERDDMDETEEEQE